VIGSDRLSGRGRTLLAGGAVFLVAIAAHYEVLGYWFTGGDTLTLIERSRIGSVADAREVLSSPLMYGTNFAINVALFYRPVANLSYALDFQLWGLDPFGYHLTDLLLHGVGSALTFALVDRVSKDRVVGMLAGCLFAVHPITAEVVPTPARRHDVLATVFVLGSVLLFVWALRVEHRRRRWAILAGSVCAYVLAVGAKEIGVLAPPLVGVWFLLVAYDRGYDLGTTVWRGTKVAVPYTIATLAYLRWRLNVLGGFGGYRPGPWETTDPAGEIVGRYLLSLVYPVDLLGLVGRGDPLSLSAGGSVAAVGAAIAASVFGALVFGVVRVGGPRAMLRSDRGRLAVLSVAWLVGLGAVFIGFGRYSLRSGYLALVPLGGLLSLVVVGAGRRVVRGQGERKRPALTTVAALGVALVVVCSLVWVSPLVYPYDGWDRAGEINARGLSAAGTAYERSDLPPRAVVAVAGLPGRPNAPGIVAEQPRTRTIPYFYANTVASWLRLTHPDSQVATYVGGRLTPVRGPVSVNATLTRTTDRQQYRLRFRYANASATNDRRGSNAIARSNG
jgi:hypothetical protein